MLHRAAEPRQRKAVVGTQLLDDGLQGAFGRSDAVTGHRPRTIDQDFDGHAARFFRWQVWAEAGQHGHALGLDLVACGDRQRVMRQLIDHQQEVAVQIRRARQ